MRDGIYCAQGNVWQWYMKCCAVEEVLHMTREGMKLGAGEKVLKKNGKCAGNC
jgi:hypothetical protein